MKYRKIAMTCVILLVMMLLPMAAVSADPGWYDTGWPYRKAITVTGSSSNLTDYQVKIPVNFVSGHMNADFSDIRFTAADGTTLLDHWQGSYTASTSAVFWVKVPSIPTAGTTIYMYYGNASATNQSSGIDTFDFFDDFEDGNYDGWIPFNIETTASLSIVMDGSNVLNVNSTPNVVRNAGAIIEQSFTDGII